MTIISHVSVSDLVASGEAELTTGPFGTQLKAGEYVEDGIPLINVRNIGFGDVRATDLEYLSEETALRLSRHRLEAADIVFGRKGAVERHAFISRDQVGWVQGSDCLRLRLRSPRFVPRFVSYFLLTEHHKQWMKNHCSGGATMASLNQEILGRIALPIVATTTQRKVAAILSAYDDLIENNKCRIGLLREIVRRIYREWFVDYRYLGHATVPLVDSALGAIPAGWRVAALSELTELIARGISPKYVEASDQLVINQKCIRNGAIDLTHARPHATAVPPVKLVRRGDVLINSTGVGTLGRVAQVLVERSGLAVDSHVTLVRPAPELAMIDFLGLAVVDLEAELASMGTGSTGQTELGRAAVGALMVVVPPMRIQEELADLVGDMRLLATSLTEATTKLRESRDLLLPRLIAGVLDVADLDIAVQEVAA
jgi:type I restriction enzyme, S subunit